MNSMQPKFAIQRSVGQFSPSEEAVKVGQLTGAKLLVTGSIVQVDEKIYVVAKIMGTETGQVVSASVDGKVGDEVGPLVEQLADKVADAIAKQSGKLVPKPVSRDDRVEALKKQLKRMKLPPVVVKITEKHIGPPAADPAAETEVTYYLKGAGFEVIDKDGAKEKADVRITGEGFTMLVTKNGSLVSVKARLEVKAVDPKTD